MTGIVKRKNAGAQITNQGHTPPQQMTNAPVPPFHADFQLIGEPSQAGKDQASATAATTPVSPPRHRPWPRLLLLLLLIGAGSWWVISNNLVTWPLSWPPSWPWPWMQPVGPLTASGTLEADEVLIGAEVAGQIIELLQEGDRVAPGAVVARLDDALIQLQIRQADLAARQRLEIQADAYQLRTPIGGVVTRVPMHNGEVVTPGQTVAAVADLTQLKFTAYVLEKDLGGVQVGQVVTVTADPFPDRTFRGVVTSTNPRAEFTPRNVQTRADRLNLVFGVQIRVDNPAGALKPGMPADASFEALPQR